MGLSVVHVSSESDKHTCNISALTSFKDQIITGSDDGILKVWTSDLKQIKQIDTQQGAVLSIAASTKTIYTCGSDQTLQVWDSESLQNIGEIKTTLSIPLKLFIETESNDLWVGDSVGNVGKYNQMQEVAKFPLVEEIWDLAVTSQPTLVYTARDRDITVSEIRGDKSQAIVRGSFFGRSPLTVIGLYLYCVDRDGKAVQIHKNSVADNFQLVRSIPVSEAILNGLCVGGDNEIYCGGYDNKISLWNLKLGSCIGSVDVNSCVNVLKAGQGGAYAAVSDGRVLFVKP